MHSPVAFFIFNRPELTARVFAEIRRARPKQLFVIADGPRDNRPGEADRCDATRRLVLDSIDWACDVRTNLADENLGCKRRVSSGLNWVFEQAPEAIILEDDCLPDPSLFAFFDAMLERYRADRRVMMVTGFNPLGQWKSERQSYHFSYCGSIWGWASWRRAWASYDVDMKRFADPECRQRVRDVFADPALYEGRLKSYEAVYRGHVDTWDMQWSFTRIIESGLSVVPARNLISNIGFGPEATHTRNERSAVANLPTDALDGSLRHPTCISVDREYDRAFTQALSQPAKAA